MMYLDEEEFEQEIIIDKLLEESYNALVGHDS